MCDIRLLVDDVKVVDDVDVKVDIVNVVVVTNH
jgi:hypothetical protein